MKTDSELEALLRTTLASRATSVLDAPAPPAELPSRRGRVWLPALAAAAAVAIAAAGVLVGVRLARSTPPSRQPAPIPARVLQSCSAPLPTAWGSAAQQGGSRDGAVSAFPIGMSADGRRILVARDFGIARDVAIVDAAGNTRSIYSVPQPEQNQVQHASIDGKYAVIDLQRLPRNANGVLGTDLAVVLVNIVTGTAKNIDAISEQDIRHGGRTIDGSLIADGQVYWDFHSAYANHAGVVKDYDVATGRTRVVYRGTVGTPMMTAFGISVSWGAQGHLVIPRTVPAPVLNALPAHARQSSPAFDGSSYAWIVGRRIGWWGPGQSQATEVTFPERVQPGLVAVAGPFVLFTDANTLNPSAPDQVLDARSGAVSILSGLQPYALSSEGVLAGYRFVHGFKTSPTEPVRIDTNALPPLTC